MSCQYDDEDLLMQKSSQLLIGLSKTLLKIAGEITLRKVNNLTSVLDFKTLLNEKRVKTKQAAIQTEDELQITFNHETSLIMKRKTKAKAVKKSSYKHNAHDKSKK